MKTILSLYDYSGIWSGPYRRAKDYRVVQVDIQHPPVMGHKGLVVHDVRTWEMVPQLYEQVYGILAAPPCTVFAGSGARWHRTEQEMIDGISMVDAVLRMVYVLKPKFWALENPVGKLVRYLGKPRFYFDPCDFGDPWTKKTCLWGEFNIPKLTPVEPTEGSKMHLMAPSEERKNLRSATPEGFARAFFKANQ